MRSGGFGWRGGHGLFNMSKKRAGVSNGRLVVEPHAL